MLNNLKLGMKMALLTVILIVTVVGVAWVSVNRLDTLNSTVQEMVNRTLRKVNLASQVRAELLEAVRQQKNAVLATDDKSSGFTGSMTHTLPSTCSTSLATDWTRHYCR